MSESPDTHKDDNKLVTPVGFGQALRKVGLQDWKEETNNKYVLITTNQQILLAKYYNTINPTPWMIPPTNEQIKKSLTEVWEIIDPIIEKIPWLWSTELTDTTKELLSALLTIKKPFQQALIQALKINY